MEIGRIEKGAAPNLILVDYYPPTPLDSGNLFGHILFGIANAPVDRPDGERPLRCCATSTASTWTNGAWTEKAAKRRVRPMGEVLVGHGRERVQGARPGAASRVCRHAMLK